MLVSGFGAERLCELMVSFCLQVPYSETSLYEGGKQTDTALTSSQVTFSIPLQIVLCQDINVVVLSGRFYSPYKFRSIVHQA